MYSNGECVRDGFIYGRMRTPVSLRGSIERNRLSFSISNGALDSKIFKVLKTHFSVATYITYRKETNARSLQARLTTIASENSVFGHSRNWNFRIRRYVPRGKIFRRRFAGIHRSFLVERAQGEGYIM